MKTAQTGIGSDQRGQTVLTQTKRSPALGRPGFSLLNSHVDSELTRSGVTRVAEGHFQPLASKRRERRIGSEQDSLILTRREFPLASARQAAKALGNGNRGGHHDSQCRETQNPPTRRGKVKLVTHHPTPLLELTPLLGALVRETLGWGGGSAPVVSLLATVAGEPQAWPGRWRNEEPRCCTRVSPRSQT